MVVDLERGAAIHTLNLDGVSVIKPLANYHFESSLLFPFPNRLANGEYVFKDQVHRFRLNDFGRPNALHGLIHDMTFQKVFHDDTSIKLNLTCKEETDAFPFQFDFSVTYKLMDSSLSVTVEIENIGNEEFPFGYGWHPYFSIDKGHQASLQLPVVSLVEVDDNLIPTGDKKQYPVFKELSPVTGHVLDNCLCIEEIQKRNSSFLKVSKHETIEIWQDEQFGFIQVFTPEDGSSVAIEPMTCNIDALNNGEGKIILGPKEHWSAKFGVDIKK